MIRKALVGAGMAGVAIAAAVALDAGHLSSYVTKLNAAQGLDVSYSINEVGGAQAKYRVVLAKPNKAMIETPTMTYVADGENLTTYDKARNSYFVKPQPADAYKALLESDEVAIWRAFFDAKVFDNVASTKNEGTRSWRGEKLTTVSAQVDQRGEYVIKLHTSQKDGLPRQAELITNVGATQNAKVISVESISTNKPADTLFAFNAPAGAKQLTEADMVAAEWMTDLDKALELAASLDRGVMIDFYADW